MPFGHGSGRYSAIHFMTTGGNGPGIVVTALSPEAMRQPSARWHTIWCADIRPHRAGVSGLIVLNRRKISALHSSRAKVFTSGSRAHQPLATGSTEGVKSASAAAFGLFQDLQEFRLLPQRVELRPCRQRRADEISLVDSAAQGTPARLRIRRCRTAAIPAGRSPLDRRGFSTHRTSTG